MLMEREDDDGSARAAAFIDARHAAASASATAGPSTALHDDGRCFGMSDARAASASTARRELLINLHGGTEPLPELYATGPARLPGDRPGAAPGRAARRACSTTLDFLEPHCAFFTFGENYGSPDCGLPVSGPLPASARPASRSCSTSGRAAAAPRERFTTVGNWRQPWRDVTFDGRALQLEQAPRVPASSSTCPRRTGAAVRAGAVELRARGPARCSRSTGWRVRARARLLDRRRRLPRLHRRLARRVHRRQGPERPAAHRLVQRPQRDLPRRRPAGDHARTPASATSSRPARACSASSTMDEVAGRGRGDQRRLRAPLPRRRGDRARVLQPRRRARAAARRRRRRASRGARLSGSARRARAVPARPGARRRSRGARRACRDATVEAVLGAPVPARAPGALRRRRPTRQHRRRHPRQPRLHPPVPRERCSPTPTYPAFEVIVVDNGSTRRHAAPTCAAGRARTRTCGSCSNDEQRRLRAAPATRVSRRRAATSSCCSTTTRSSRPAGSRGSSRTSPTPASGWPARSRTGSATRPRSRPPTDTWGEFLRARRAAAPREHAGAVVRHPTADDVLPGDAPRRLRAHRPARRALRGRHARGRRLLAARARRPATGCVCAEDVFVHHFGEASFGELVADRRVRRAPRGEQAALRGEVGPARGSRTGAGAKPRVRACHASASGQVVADAAAAERAPCWSSAAATTSCSSSRASGARHFPEAEDGSLGRPPPGRQRGGGRAARGAASGGGRVPALARAPPLVARPLRGPSRAPREPLRGGRARRARPA